MLGHEGKAPSKSTCILCEGGPDASMELGVVQLGESSTCHLQLEDLRQDRQDSKDSVILPT